MPNVVKSQADIDAEVLREVFAERKRQIEVEGFTSLHDDENRNGQLADAAACYALAKPMIDPDREVPFDWPWAKRWWKPKDRRRNLIMAAALIVAEIERLDRASR